MSRKTRPNPVVRHMHLTTRSAGAHGKQHKVERRNLKSQLRKGAWDSSFVSA